MKETSKSKNIWGALEKSILTGTGIDIGCGPDPVKPDVRRFDIQDGDANEISKYVDETFDYVYSSHCLEHMHDPRKTILEWWKLMRVGGHLFFVVPDEDLYEQGIFPSRFNFDHKATFTISKAMSWSSVSINVFDLARSLPQGEIVSLVLQDCGYNRRRMKHGSFMCRNWERFFLRLYYFMARKCGRLGFCAEWMISFVAPIDQTIHSDRSAQIQCIVRKLG